MTPTRIPLWVLSRDPVLLDRLTPLLASAFELTLYEHEAEFRNALSHQQLCLCLIDLRLGDEGPLPHELVEELRQHVLTLLGPKGSLHLRELEQRQFYALLDTQVDPVSLLHTLQQAQVFLNLREENQRLRSRLHFSPPNPVNPDGQPPSPLFSPEECIRFFHEAEKPEQLADSLIHHLCSRMKLSRAGLYLRDQDTGAFRLHAGHMLLPGSRRDPFAQDDPFIRWLERNACVVSRADLHAERTTEEEAILGRALDQWGAELLVPLRGREGLMGWVFTGRLFSGHRFRPGDLSTVMEAVDLMAAALERASEQSRTQTAYQKSCDLLQELHIGLLHASVTGSVLWASDTARQHLNLTHAATPLRLNPELTRLIQEAAKDEDGSPSRFTWRHPQTGRDFSLQARRIHASEHQPSVLVTLEDRSAERQQLEGRRDREEQRLWEQMSDGLSHEVRNPLVTIKTFTQLLPERIDDPRFRTVFERQVEQEIDKLQGLVEQVQSFARQEDLHLETVDVRSLLTSIAGEFRSQLSTVTGAPDFQLSLQPELPALTADAKRIRTALLHLLENAWEAVQGSQGSILFAAHEADGALHIDIQDNGNGCPPDKLDVLFSPFLTTKAQGMGLGLPIARRIAREHGGDVSLISTPRGTHATLTIPNSPPTT